MILGIDPKVDYVFKRLFGVDANRPLLVHLLNAVLQWPAGRRLRELELLNPFNDREYLQDKLTVVDVKARDQGGRQHHVEMQLSVPWGFDKRILYYWAKFHQQQMQEGDFYQTLCPTVSVWWLEQDLFPDAACHHKFQLWDPERSVLLSKDLEIHTLELGKFKLSAEQVSTDEERWCYFLKHGAALDSDRLPAALDQPIFHQAVEVLRVVSQNELERHRYEDRLKAQRDAASLAYASQHAQEHGIEIGLERGRLEGRIEVCQRLLQQPVLSAEEAQRLSLEQLTKLAEELEQQLRTKQAPQ
jgi:predicted transposase/invertase (TIGR01784 family)